jgi:hypothetical protein
MKIRLLTARATATGAQNRGDTIDVPEAEAIRMIEGGQAEPVREQREPEKAVRRGKPKAD